MTVNQSNHPDLSHIQKFINDQLGNWFLTNHGSIKISFSGMKEYMQALDIGLSGEILQNRLEFCKFCIDYLKSGSTDILGYVIKYFVRYEY